MKSPGWSIAGIPALLLLTSTLSAQTDAASRRGTPGPAVNAIVVESGPHHTVRRWTTESAAPDGRAIAGNHSVTELASGMNYLKDGQWVPSQEVIEIFPDGAVARQGQHQVIFAANLNSQGAIDLLTPRGDRLRSHVIGLAFLDSATGQSTLIAGIKDSFGEVIGNQVIYRDAFDGPFKADVRYTYTKAGFEQDILIREAIPSPAEYQMGPDTTRLEVWTEFLDPPAPVIRGRVLRAEADPKVRPRKAIPDLVDQTLSFAFMEIGSGRAFPLGADRNDNRAVRVSKSWVLAEGRRFLVESVELPDVAALLQELPRAAAPAVQRNARLKAPTNRGVQMARLFPPAPGKKVARPLQMASAAPTGLALVLDYQTLNSSLTNYNFQADQTYSIVGAVNLYGSSNVIEGGTVIKFAKDAGATIDVKGTLIGDTAMYRPAVLTASADSSIGESLGGTLSGHYATTALNFDYVTSGQPASLQNIRILYALTAVAFNGGAGHELRHLQIGDAGTAVKSDNAQYAIRNALGWNLTNALTGSSSTGAWEHATFNGVTNLLTSVSGLFTNCLLTAVVDTNGLAGASNVVLSSASGVFKAVGSGYHYLTNASPYRDIGTTNINPTLANELKTRTTYPPVVLTNHITNDTVLSPRAERDTGRIDAGYHYAPIDFAFSQIALSNASLAIGRGTVLGLFGAGGTSGLTLLDGARIYCEGSPSALNYIARYNLIQEVADSSWSSANAGRFISTPGTYATNLLPTEAHFRFTEWSMPAGGSDHFYAGATNLALSFQDCQFKGGQLTLVQPDVTIRNSLFERVSLNLDASANPFTASVQNCTILGGSLVAQNGVAGSWTFTDNLFDTTNIVQTGSISNNYNAYLTNSIRLTPNGGNDILLAVENITYDAGGLGRFYLPTNLTSQSVLLNAGSRTADAAGLYHYTTSTNQTRELTSQVDIGFHYVAVSSSGQPIDTDGDGLPDYFEDANGNGSTDTGETGWSSPSTDGDTDGDGVSDYLEYLLGRNPLVAGGTVDSSDVIKFRLYTPLK